ncbi:uncharacterized protein NMK_0051 [Novimethylophilus kurashikiensis]|uniref:histidine kinase n=1 Tax=Novimethylophilus kurashikiensis TaxID=1825523 RepID=A0A2R5F1B2_9PROT|nr:ATP-binding protein [Novimethylophilus kurashikiensis]GBG12520.1 uncharacterized protein NMK_0051 [Novimethylophilus kurashikiensis]
MIPAFFRSMSGRVFLILFIGVIAAAALVLTLAAYTQREMISQIRARHAAERVEQLVLTLEASPAASRGALAEIAQRFGARVDFADTHDIRGFVPDEEFAAVLAKTLGASRMITAYEREGLDCPVRPGPTLSDSKRTRCRTVFLTLNDGAEVRMDVAMPADSTLPPFRKDFLPYLLVFVLCVGVLAVLVALMSTRPLRKMAQAAHALGLDIERDPLPENRGPTEVRDAASAFNSMQLRIRNYIQERTHMLAAIAHDLQTPLTRLRLRLEKVADEELRDKLIADLSTTQGMVKEGLELARSQDAQEAFELLDVDSLIASLCCDAEEAGMEVTHSSHVGVSIMARPTALRRCLLNLIDNAVKYGQFAHVAAKREGDKVVVSVVDGGPGIPDEQMEAVFQPFYRLETSRSREFGGTGLGLTIARNIAEKHRGTLKLRNVRAGGLGLEVSLTLSVV